MIVQYAKYFTVETQLLLDNEVHMSKTAMCFDMYMGHFQGRSNCKTPCWGR